MPADTVKVDRATPWGNPFRIGERYSWQTEDGAWAGDGLVKNAADAVAFFRSWATQEMSPLPDMAPLRGKNLACWCPADQPCHADVLLDLANPKCEAVAP